MSYVAHEETHGAITLKIIADDSPDSPRSWGPLGHIVMWDQGKHLSDNNLSDNALDSLIDLTDIKTYNEVHNELQILSSIEDSATASATYIQQVKNRIANTLFTNLNSTQAILEFDYAYHSHASEFSCIKPLHKSLDCNFNGIIYCSLVEASRAFNTDLNWNAKVPNLKKTLKEHTLDILRSELQIYQDYLTGEVYGYSIETTEGEILDSCWGFYGYFDENHDALKEGRSILKGYLPHTEFMELF